MSKLVSVIESLGEIALLFRNTLLWLFKSKIDKNSLVNLMIEVGNNSFMIVFLASLFTGMVLALQSGVSSSYIFNEPVYVGTVVSFSIVKELGPVLTSVLIAGRIGAAFAAEIGTMRVTEQIDALYTLGTNPIKYLVVPRFLACITMIPLLTIFSNFIGILGGFLITSLKWNISPKIYYDDCFQYMKLDDFFHGLIKSFFFAVIIVIISCHKGLTCSGGAEGVGKSTTQAVMLSILWILILDYFISSLLITFRIG